MCLAQDKARGTQEQASGQDQSTGQGSSTVPSQITAPFFLRQDFTLSALALAHASVFRVATTVRHGTLGESIGAYSALLLTFLPALTLGEPLARISSTVDSAFLPFQF